RGTAFGHGTVDADTAIAPLRTRCEVMAWYQAPTGCPDRSTILDPLAGMLSATTQHAPANAQVKTNSTQLDASPGLVITAGTHTRTVNTLSMAASAAAAQRG